MYYYIFKCKSWYFNMNNMIVNFLHMGEDNCMRFIHMNDKSRIDRVACRPKIFRWR